ncbi:transposase [Lentzea sp. DG1S-22]|nr:transposase [Lentzea sp. DG1S-22]WVH84347.1 transposase [Lentzea sp. DG1S-22]
MLIVGDTGFLKRALVQRLCSSSIRGPPVARRTVRWACSWPTRRRGARVDRPGTLSAGISDRDPSLCRAAGVPGEVEFATKPRNAMAMTERTLEVRVPFRWVTADEADRQAKHLRFWLEQRDVA